MTVVLSELKTELETDPTGLGYAPFVASGNHTQLAKLVNSLTATQIDKASVGNDDIIRSLDYTEVEALATVKRETLAVLTQPDTIPIEANTKNAFASIFGPGTNSRASLVAISKKTAARAEILFGVGTSVSSGHVRDALALP